MNDPELRNLLLKSQAPRANEARSARALDRALIALRNAPIIGKNSSWGFRVGLAAAACAACAAFVLVFHGESAEASARILTEMEQVFPGQLQAVILNGSQTDLRLSTFPENGLATNQRVRVIVETANGTTEILTYSGRRICIPLKSGTLCLTPLLTAQGDVLVVTDDNAFAGTGRASSARISARSLSPS